MTSSLIRGEIVHARNDVHARRVFRYPVYIAALDLDALPRLRLFSYNARNLFSLYDRDYADLRGHHALLAREGIAPPARTELVTNLRVLGYVFNPVSFFLGYDGAEITSVVAEVNNTYGGRHQYVFGPAQRIGPARFRRERALFVSPFLHGDATYELAVTDAPDALAITMHVLVEGTRVFTAKLSGRRHPFTDAGLAKVALRYPLMTAQVIGLIHYEALKLHLRGVPYRRPGADHRPIAGPNNIVSRAPPSASMK
jgi:DUF1365 family protein